MSALSATYEGPAVAEAEEHSHLLHDLLVRPSTEEA